MPSNTENLKKIDNNKVLDAKVNFNEMVEEEERSMLVSVEETTMSKKKHSIKKMQNVSTYTMCFIISFLIGYSFTSHGLITDNLLKSFSDGYFDEYHELLGRFCPVFLYLGSIIGTFIMLMSKRYSHLRLIQLSSLLFFCSYFFQMICPNILVVLAMRFYMGIASGFSTIIVPQILYFKSKEGLRGLTTSFFPFFILAGLISAVELVPYVTLETYFHVSKIPLLLSLISIIYSLCSSELLAVKKEKGLIEVTKFMFRSNALKSTALVILVHLFQKTTGYDLIFNFSGPLYGEHSFFKNHYSLMIAGLVNLSAGLLSDILGRKLLIVANLSLICLITLSMGFYGLNIRSLIEFIIVFNGGLGVIPYFYQNETVPAQYISTINEVGTLTNVLFGLFVALYVLFLFSPSNTTIWYAFSGLSCLGAIIMGIVMPETQGTSVSNHNFIKNWFNFSFKNKNLQ